MNNKDIDKHKWVIQNGKAYANGLDESFVSFVENGIYEGVDLEILWQYKSEEEIFWDNVEGEPTAELRQGFIVRQIIRLATNEKYANPDKHSFQGRVLPWLVTCFGTTISADVQQRTHRFLEEALELVQSTGCTREDAYALIDYVFNRPVGKVDQEVGGVMVTLAALCLATKIDMERCGEKELAYNWTRVDNLRAKEASRVQSSALPGISQT